MILHIKEDAIHVTGPLVKEQWPVFRSVVALLLNQYQRGGIIDISGLTDISEAGAQTLVEASSFARARNSRIVIVAPPGKILDKIELSSALAVQLIFFPSIEHARAALEAGELP
jgi:anti-anti-sigma regulatory factor